MSKEDEAARAVFNSVSSVIEPPLAQVFYTKEMVSVKGKAVSACMLQNSMCFVTGLALGTALGVQKKSLRPFLGGVLLGTAGDILYGQMFECRELIDDYSKAKKAFAMQQQQNIGEA